MVPVVKVVTDVVQTFGCVWLIVILIFTLVTFAIFGIFTTERWYHMNEELALLLAHIAIFWLREYITNEDRCAAIAALVHYFYTVEGTFFALEAIHDFSYTVNAINSAGFFSRPMLTIMGWGGPALFMILVSPGLWVELPSHYGCWFNFANRGVLVLLGGVFIGVNAVALVSAESCGIFSTSKTLPLTNLKKSTTISLSLASLFAVVPINFLAWFLGALAIFDQNVILFGPVLTLNLALGVVIWTTHTLADAKVRQLVVNISGYMYYYGTMLISPTYDPKLDLRITRKSDS